MGPDRLLTVEKTMLEGGGGAERMLITGATVLEGPERLLTTEALVLEGSVRLFTT